MRSLFSWAFLLSLVPCIAAGPEGMLWRISHPGRAAVSYVLGTMHSADARAFRHFDRYLEALRQCDVVMGELDMGLVSAKSTDPANLRTMMLPDGTELKDLYSKREFKKVDAMLKKELGPMALFLGRVKPFFLSAMLSETVMKQDSAAVLDDLLQRRARSMGKEVGGLETVAEQLQAVDRIPLEEQADMLLDLVKNDLYRQDMDRMMAKYGSDDLQGLWDLGNSMGMTDQFERSLLDDRNGVMVHRMDSLMGGGRSHFFAVGALHLPAEDGVLQGLRDRGYLVEAVRND